MPFKRAYKSIGVQVKPTTVDAGTDTRISDAAVQTNKVIILEVVEETNSKPVKSIPCKKTENNDNSDAGEDKNVKAQKKSKKRRSRILPKKQPKKAKKLEEVEEEEEEEVDDDSTYLDIPCSGCNSLDDPQNCLICEKCEKECWHYYCLVPPLECVPGEKEPWYCPTCQETINLKNKKQEKTKDKNKEKNKNDDKKIKLSNCDEPMEDIMEAVQPQFPPVPFKDDVVVEPWVRTYIHSQRVHPGTVISPPHVVRKAQKMTPGYVPNCDLNWRDGDSPISKVQIPRLHDVVVTELIKAKTLRELCFHWSLKDDMKNTSDYDLDICCELQDANGGGSTKFRGLTNTLIARTSDVPLDANSVWSLKGVLTATPKDGGRVYRSESRVAIFVIHDGEIKTQLQSTNNLD